jgi:hypothetical protein
MYYKTSFKTFRMLRKKSSYIDHQNILWTIGFSDYRTIGPDYWAFGLLGRHRFCMHNVLSKNRPRFLTNEALVTIVPSKERQHSENSFTWSFSANAISSVLSWFNLSIFELIHTLTSDKQVYHPSLLLYLPTDSISKTRIKVRVSWAGLINSEQELLIYKFLSNDVE